LERRDAKIHELSRLLEQSREAVIGSRDNKMADVTALYDRIHDLEDRIRCAA